MHLASDPPRKGEPPVKFVTARKGKPPSAWVLCEYSMVHTYKFAVLLDTCKSAVLLKGMVRLS